MANVVTGFLNRVFNSHLNGPRYTNPVVDNFLGLTSSGETQFDAQMSFNKSEAEKQRLWEEMMWDKANEYNSPAAQMQRLRDAGLNPSLVNGMEPVAADVPTGSEASMSGASNGSFDRLLGLGKDAIALPAQIDLMRAQAEEIRSRIPLNQQRTANLRTAMDDILASIAQRYADIQLKYSQTNLNGATRENISFEQIYKQGLLSIDYQRLQNENQLTKANVSKLEAETKSALARANVTERELQEMIWTYSIRAQGLEKQNLLTDAKIAEANATADKLKKEGIRVEQITAIDSPKAINSQSWADDMSGKNGVANQIGASITYQIVEGIKSVGGILLK